MKKISIKKVLFTLIILLAIFLRFYQLGKNPSSLDWDEASLGYNAYSILKTGRDEYGTFLPAAIRSFGDYKPPLYVYITVPSVAVFGLTEFAVRLPSAVFGSLAVAMTYFLVSEIFAIYALKKDASDSSRSKSEFIAFGAMFLLAISPWHLQFSRVAFEANVALTLFIGGSWLFFRGITKGWFLMLSSILFSLSLYAYHSPRLVVPLLLVGFSILFWKQLIRQWKYSIIATIIGLLMMIPLVNVLTGAGKARFSSVTVLTGPGTLDDSIRLLEQDRSRGDLLGSITHNRRVVYTWLVAKGYLDHFNLDFLFLTGDGPGRHHAADMGMLYLIEAPFLLLGLLELIKKRQWWAAPFIWWFMVAPCASALTSGTPHAVRALLYLPTYQVFTAYGVYEMMMLFQKQSHPKLFIRFSVIGLFALNIVYYFHMYYIHTPSEHAKEWQYGYRETIGEILKREDSVDKIIMTYAYDQPYIYVLFYGKVDPFWYQQHWGDASQRAFRAFGKYEFRSIDWERDKLLHNTILVGTPGEIPQEAPGKIDISYPDGSIAFRVILL